MWTRPWLLAAHLALLALPQHASAADRVQECIGEHVEAQLLRNQGRLQAARARLSECAKPTCPALVREECITLRREVVAALPSVTVNAIDKRGQPTYEPSVSIDGVLEPVPLDGRAITLDPGVHRLRFEHPDGSVREERLVLAESESRLVVADFRSKAEKRRKLRDDRWTNVTLASAGVAVVALGSFTFFALNGRAVESELDRCKPNCENRSDVERMRSRYLLADVSLGVALVSVGVAAYAWMQRPSASFSGQSESATRRGLSVQPVATHRRVGLWATGEF